MHIEFVEVANFRKLMATRIDLSPSKTLFVGANNSGKTSAMLTLRRFLSPRRCPFEFHDFTLCHWPVIDLIGQNWIAARAADELVELDLGRGLERSRCSICGCMSNQARCITSATYSSGPVAVRDGLIARNWFDADEIEIVR